MTVLDGITKTIGTSITSLTGVQRDTALTVLDGITKTIGTSITSLTGAQRDTAVSVLNGITKTIGLTAAAISATQRDDALSSLNYMSRTVALTLTQFSPADSFLIQAATAASTKTITAALGSGDAQALALANATSGMVYRTLQAAGGYLTDDQRAFLQAAAYGSSTVTLSASGAVTWNESAAIKSVFDAIKENTNTSTATLSTMSNNWSPLFTGMHTALSNLNQYAQVGGARVKFDRGTASGTSGGSVFASGGAFTNGVVSRPTSFDMGLMGEAGPEAIMPLTNVGGKLGVRSSGGGNNNAEAAKTNALLAEVLMELRADKTQRAAVSDATLEKLDILATKADATKRELARV